jgi:hypothetical protein
MQKKCRFLLLILAVHTLTIMFEIFNFVLVSYLFLLEILNVFGKMLTQNLML